GEVTPDLMGPVAVGAAKLRGVPILRVGRPRASVIQPLAGQPRRRRQNGRKQRGQHGQEGGAEQGTQCCALHERSSGYEFFPERSGAARSARDTVHRGNFRRTRNARSGSFASHGSWICKSSTSTLPQ